ncbi:MBL fold metallo-hydrolase [Herbiconiux sp. CPCC 205716]|uniref:MBL fold metallo-hydrolase n=1 Tax=Herbiconiux gentiana TaxID=2970912 RepID=A0ABT2GGD8_9MICO|nr:MBL fold metallo-hydrolase [Herbiconiux gentiana]MCS5715161.1 MBL fold metallo-hydrolase [Herbiconiux gentiana]
MTSSTRPALWSLRPRSRPRLTRNVAPGVHRLEHAHVNLYLIDDGAAGVTVVDAAFPDTWLPLRLALEAIGRQPRDVRALVLTHAHFDHVGVAARVRAEWGVPVWVHEGDRRLAAHPYRYRHERSRLLYPVTHPRAVPVLGAMTRAGALRVKGVPLTQPVPDGGALDVPGRPLVVRTPGHTDGHTGLHLPERDALLTGDALVTLDPYTGRTGPQIVSGAATADSATALRSLDALAATGARIVLPGHGEPLRTGIRTAAAAARAAGAH